MCIDFVWSWVYKILWDLLCWPKLEGVGLWKYTYLNNIARLKLLWNLLTSDILWSRWMKAKYLSKSDFWTIPINNNFLGIMKSILKQRETTCKIMNKIIVNGHDTLLLFNPWINYKSLVDLIGWSSVHMYNRVHCTISLILQNHNLYPHLF